MYRDSGNTEDRFAVAVFKDDTVVRQSAIHVPYVRARARAHGAV